ncbi:DUF551 domain-containing protein [Phaeobacter gallaeciensis]|uniref:DUF551 domain-containing protein n=1 Tax=Phaeobacter gallaeciensis TaxID=60890 RepID=A0AAD0EDH6_9RHOB|nr:hypothetical protein Gal_02296 [Phaeobacter gallaeciensis DSM 26640]ATE93307.1 hypothetical protein PhaeoP11_02287 [Phaeobacter gallaeciensis]ATE96872.1 hypothetical protein PhaeoP73_01560 [Phaeobacter gallaeciensis]ATF01971.1 hypothetical protein PhaeoP75_02336 [Phaeobacter gallaeciensis]ATF06351.1 hypothetical protein PhaeoP63_02285 [Phaeobacter gallaeciensis]
MDWQPIETAPKDGTEILAVYVPSGKFSPDFSIVEWDGKSWVGKCDGYRSIEAQSDFHTNYHEPFLTHWMPLPEPPKDPQ